MWGHALESLAPRAGAAHSARPTPGHSILAWSLATAAPSPVNAIVTLHCFCPRAWLALHPLPTGRCGQEGLCAQKAQIHGSIRDSGKLTLLQADPGVPQPSCLPAVGHCWAHGWCANAEGKYGCLLHLVEPDALSHNPGPLLVLRACFLI